MKTNFFLNFSYSTAESLGDSTNAFNLIKSSLPEYLDSAVEVHNYNQMKVGNVYFQTFSINCEKLSSKWFQLQTDLSGLLENNEKLQKAYNELEETQKNSKESYSKLQLELTEKDNLIQKFEEAEKYWQKTESENENLISQLQDSLKLCKQNLDSAKIKLKSREMPQEILDILQKNELLTTEILRRDSEILRRDSEILKRDSEISNLNKDLAATREEIRKLSKALIFAYDNYGGLTSRRILEKFYQYIGEEHLSYGCADHDSLYMDKTNREYDKYQIINHFPNCTYLKERKLLVVDLVPLFKKTLGYFNGYVHKEKIYEIIIPHDCDEEIITAFYRQEPENFKKLNGRSDHESLKITKINPYYNYQDQIEHFYAYEKT